MYIVCANASNNTPFDTHVSSYMVWEFTPGQLGWLHNQIYPLPIHPKNLLSCSDFNRIASRILNFTKS